ncbi:MAG: hypothetical protein ICV79_12515 [Flavisolibacter sp.]|nr:hypothetical protein [Flavisolibacter sp.]
MWKQFFICSVLRLTQGRTAYNNRFIYAVVGVPPGFGALAAPTTAK